MILGGRREKLPCPVFGQRSHIAEDGVYPGQLYFADVLEDFGSFAGLASAQVPEFSVLVGADDQEVVAGLRVTAPHAGGDHGHVPRLDLYSDTRLVAENQTR